MARRFFQAAQRAAQANVRRFPSPTPYGDVLTELRKRPLSQERFLTPEEVAQILRKPSAKRVYDLIHQHHLPARRIGHSFLIEEAELQAWSRSELNPQRGR